MRKFILKIALFFIAVSVIDVFFGFACQYMNSHAKGGGIRSRYYVCKEAKENVLVFGSSRAKHHYVPDVIEDSLGMSCYNTGEDGNGIILCYGFLRMVTERYSPKMIIYDVSTFDVLEDDNVKYLDLMKPYYNESGIDSIFWDIDPKTRYMMISSLYRYNTTWLRVAGSYVRPVTNYPKGYAPLNKTMDYDPESLAPQRIVIDSVKIDFFEKFIRLAKNRDISLICCVSPIYKGTKENGYYTIKNLCTKYEIPFLFYGADTDMIQNKSFFQDKLHLNDKGARFYTRKVVEWIKNNNN